MESNARFFRGSFVYFPDRWLTFFFVRWGVDTRRVCDVTHITQFLSSHNLLGCPPWNRDIITIRSLPNISGQITIVPKPELR